MTQLGMVYQNINTTSINGTVRHGLSQAQLGMVYQNINTTSINGTVRHGLSEY